MKIADTFDQTAPTQTAAQKVNVMKIDGSEGIFQIPDPERMKKPVGRSEGNFHEILQRTASRPAAGVPLPTSVSFVQGPSAPAGVSLQPPTQASVLRGVERLLDLMDDYRRGLCAPGTDLRSIERTVKKLDSERAALTPAVEALPAADTLKSIADESLVAASVAVFKFYRGDYLGA